MTDATAPRAAADRENAAPLLPGLLPQARVPWIVEVTGEEPPEARDWNWNEYDDLVEQHGEDTDELIEALGPTPGYQPVTLYGPYTERQARALAAWLNRPEVAERRRISLARPLPLGRFAEACTPRRRPWRRPPAPTPALPSYASSLTTPTERTNTPR